MLNLPNKRCEASQLREVVNMKIVVQPYDQGGERLWQVRLDQHRVSFRSEAEAQQFVARLEARLLAPHVLPDWPAQRKAG